LRGNAAAYLHQRIIATKDTHGYDGQRALEARVDSFDPVTQAAERAEAEKALEMHHEATPRIREGWEMVHRYGSQPVNGAREFTEPEIAALNKLFEEGVDAKLAELLGGPEVPIKGI
jgi:hypothetical protein